MFLGSSGPAKSKVSCEEALDSAELELVCRRDLQSQLNASGLQREGPSNSRFMCKSLLLSIQLSCRTQVNTKIYFYRKTLMAELKPPLFCKAEELWGFFFIGNINENVKNTSIAVKCVLSPSLGVQNS